MKQVTWIFDFDDDFDAPQTIAKYVNNYVVLEDASVISSWPQVKPPFVAYGTMRKLIQLSRHKELCEAVFDEYVSLRCSSYYRVIYPFLKRKTFIVPFISLSSLNWSLIFNEQMFIRPDGNHKPFEAEIVATKDIQKFVEKHISKQQYELIVVSEVIEMGQEFRCFCRNGEVVCCSSYPNIDVPTPKEVIQFASFIAQEMAEYYFCPMLTIDIAKSNDMKVVEIGGVNSWGIYGGDIHAFIEAMEMEAISRLSVK